METLQRLVADYLAANGLSPYTFAANAEAAGFPISHTTIYRIKNGKATGKQTPATLDAIAAVTGYGRKRLYAANGLPVPGKSFASELPADVDYLGRADRSAVLAVIRSLLDHSSPLRNDLPVSALRDTLALAADLQAEPIEADQDEGSHDR